MNIYDELQSLKTEVKNLKLILGKHANFLKLCTGQPIIYANGNKRFDLNENLNVIELDKKLDSKEPLLSFESTGSIEVTKENQVVSMEVISAGHEHDDNFDEVLFAG